MSYYEGLHHHKPPSLPLSPSFPPRASKGGGGGGLPRFWPLSINIHKAKPAATLMDGGSQQASSLAHTHTPPSAHAGAHKQEEARSGASAERNVANLGLLYWSKNLDGTQLRAVLVSCETTHTTGTQ